MTDPTPCGFSPDQACAMEEKLDKLLAEVERLTLAFPRNSMGEADLAGHRSSHEAQERAARAQEEFWQKATQKGAIAVLAIGIGLATLGLLYRVAHWFGLTLKAPPF